MDEDNQLYEHVADDVMDAELSGPQVQPVNEEPAISNANQAPATDGFYEWELRNFAKLTDKLQSETFEVGTYLWRMLCFPRGNQQPHKYLSLFLEYPEAAFGTPHISPKASFKLIVKNHLDPAKDFVKDTCHTFTAEQVDWGFGQMLPLADATTKMGYVREDGTLVVRAEISIQRDERYSYDSRAETGHVGLKNQGATCYMNSLLQCLYNLPKFRQAVYHMPIPENEEATKSLPVALQSLFYRLQYARSAASTKELTKSFGWNTYDAFMQHDVQELNRVLCEKLEEKMKNTRVEKAIQELFEGHTYSFIECIAVDYKSTRKESFMDLQLDVKGCRNVYESFDKYTEVEILNGQNQYKTDDYGMQDARKGILFESFPPVLQLQLKRFEYDCQRDAMVKINDRYEFYDALDLDTGNGKYLAPAADRSVRNTYRLHSVLVHSGGVHGGHYYGFIRPDGKQWLKFDDDRVTKEDARTATEAQFGGTGEEDGSYPAYGGYALGQPVRQGPPLRLGKYSNAYMLVYVREADWPSVMCEVTKDDISRHLLDRLEQEMRDKEARQRDKAEAHLYCMLKVAMEQDIRDQVGRVSHFDLVDHDRLPPERCHYRLRKQTKFEDFKKEVARRTGIPPHRQRYWAWKRRGNNTNRPFRPLTPGEEASQLMDLREIRTLPEAAQQSGGGGAVRGSGGGGGGGAVKSALMDIRLYLETVEEGEEFAPVAGEGGKEGHVLLFFKQFDPLAQSITYRTHHLLGASLTADALATHLREDDGLPPDTPLALYEEVKFEPSVWVQPLEARKQLREQDVEHGDIIVYQRLLSEEEAAAASPPPRYTTADAYLSYVHNRRQVHFKKLEEASGPPVVTLELLRDTTYEEVCSSLASALGLPDPTRLRLTRHNHFSGVPQKAPVKWRTINSLQALLTHQSHATDTLYYEVLDMPLEEMEKHKTVKVVLHNERGEAVGEPHVLRLRREAAVSDLLAEVASRLQQRAAAPAADGGGGGEGGGPAPMDASTPPPPPAVAAAPASGTGTGGTAAAPAADAAALAEAAALAAAGRPMRLLEVQTGRIYKIISPADTIDSLNEGYWQMRVEFVPADQLPGGLGPHDRLVHVAHMLPPPLPSPPPPAAAAEGDGEAGARPAGGGAGPAPMDAEGGGPEGEEGADGATTRGEGGGAAAAQEAYQQALHTALIEQMPGAAYGDPLLVRVRENESMADLKARLQALLGVAAEDFAKWHVLFVGSRPNNALLLDSENLTEYFKGHTNKVAPPATAAAAVGGAPTSAVLMEPSNLTLALLHEDSRVGGAGRRAAAAAAANSNRYAYEKPVKIYG